MTLLSAPRTGTDNAGFSPKQATQTQAAHSSDLQYPLSCQKRNPLNNRGWRHDAIPGLLALLCLLPICREATAQANLPTLRLDPHGHTAAVNGLLFEQDGKHLLSVGADGAVRVWNLDTRQIDHMWRYPANAANRCKYYHAALSSAVPARLAIGEIAENNAGPVEILIIDPANGKLIKRISNQHKIAITGLAFRADGKQLAACDAEGRVCVYETTDSDHWTARQILEAKFAEGKAEHPCHSLAYSPNGEELATGRADTTKIPNDDRTWKGEVQIWNSHTYKLEQRKKLSPSVLNNLAWSSQDEIAASDFNTTTKSSKVILWKPGGQADPRELQEQHTIILSLTFTPDGLKLLTALDGANNLPGTIQTWDTTNGQPDGAPFNEHKLPITSVAVSTAKAANGSCQVASGDFAGGIYVWNSQTQQEEWSPGARHPIYHVAWSGDGHQLAWNLRSNDAANYDYAFDMYRAVPISVKNLPGNAAKMKVADGGRSLDIISDRHGVNVRINGRVASTIKEKGDCYATALTQDNQAIIASGRHVARYDVAQVSLDNKAIELSANRLYTGYQGVILNMAISPQGDYLVGASSAQTILIWSLTDPGEGANHEVRPLLTIYVGSTGEWVAWNEQTGYYTASGAGDNLLTWQVDHDQDTLAEIRTAWQCRKQFYQPDLICDLLRAGSIQKAISDVNLKEAHMQNEILNAPILHLVSYKKSGDDQNAAPEVKEIASRSAQIELRVKSEDPSPSLDVELKVNRRVQSSSRRGVIEQPGAKELEIGPSSKLKPPIKDSVSGDWIVLAELTPGENDILITARNAEGTEGTLPLSVRYDTENLQTLKRTLHIVAAGISNYPHLPGASLNYPDKDARDIVSAFEKHYMGLYDTIDIQILADKADRQATKENILKALEKLKTANPQDTVILFLSGHGQILSENGQVLSENGPANSSAKKYVFVPADAQLNAAGNAYENTISWDDILKDVSQLPAKNVLILVDHCHSGGATETKYANEIWRSANEKSVLILTSSTASQKSYEDPTRQQGMFTWALLQVLNGNVPSVLDNKNQVILLRAYAYIREMVEKISGEQYPNAPQQPYLWQPQNANIGIPLVMFGPLKQAPH